VTNDLLRQMRGVDMHVIAEQDHGHRGHRIERDERA